ncbi:hypothetical protein DFH09DRAFT_1080655 [Mycena vulgaris]|nr:hypothetical protein DFH09DRAFT_1080655 [Mycena vulgaris]
MFSTVEIRAPVRNCKDAGPGVQEYLHDRNAVSRTQALFLKCKHLGMGELWRQRSPRCGRERTTHTPREWDFYRDLAAVYLFDTDISIFGNFRPDFSDALTRRGALSVSSSAY